MIRSHPIKLIVAVLLLLLAGLAGMWLSILPNHLLAKAARHLADENGLVLEGERPRLRFHDGLTLQVDSVGFSSRDSDVVSATARQAIFAIGWSSLFGRTPHMSKLTLDAPVITLDISKSVSWGVAIQQVSLRDATLRLKDDKLKAIVSLADVNGSWTTKQNGEATLEATYLQEQTLMRFSAEVESAQRFFSDGSPSDMTLTGKNMTMAFSGRASFATGLQFDGQLNVEAASLGSLAQALGITLSKDQPLLPLSLNAGLSLGGLSASLNALQGKVDAVTVTGQLGIMAGADRMLVSGALNVDSMSMWDTQNPLATAWSETPLPLFDLLTLDSDITLKTDKLVVREVDVGAAAFAISGKDGAGKLTVTSEAFAGGRFSTTLNLTRDGLDGTVLAKTVDAQKALAALLGVNWLSGPLDFTLDFKSKGTSVASLIGTATGTLSLSSTALGVDGLDVADLKQPAIDWRWQTGRTSKAIKATLQGDIQDGIVTLFTADLTGVGLAAKLVGEVDALRQHLALSFAPKSKGVAEGLSLGGPWTQPTLSTASPEELRKSKDTGTPPQAAAPPAN